MNHANAYLQQVSKYGSSFTRARRSFQIDDESRIYSVPPCIDVSPVGDTNLRFCCLYFRWACIDQVSHKTYTNRDDLHKGSKQSSTRYTEFWLVAEIKLTSFLGSNLYWLVSGPCLVRQKIQGGWCTFASSAVLEGCMMFHFASLGQGAASTVSALVQPCKWCTEWRDHQQFRCCWIEFLLPSSGNYW